MTQALNEGLTLFIPGSGPEIRVGATVTATGGPVQVDILTAQSPSNYDGRLSSLIPIANLGNTYYSLVSTTQEGGGTMVWNDLLAQNPNNNPITINVACMAGTVGYPAPQILAAHRARFFRLPLSLASPNTLTGARLTSAGGEFLYADNVAIRSNELPVVVTNDNIPGDANPDLLSGFPSTLVRQDGGFSLVSGESMTVTCRVRGLFIVL